MCVTFFFGVLSFIQIVRYQRFKYNMLLNPIFIFTPFYLALFIIMRVGAMDQFDPSFSKNQQGLIGKSYLDVVGYFPEILILIEIGLCMLIDQIFYKCMDSSIRKFVVEQHHPE